MKHDSGSNSESSSPAAKITKCDASFSQSEALNNSLPRSALQSIKKTVSPAFASRAEYIKLLFRKNPEVNVKFRWLSKVVKMFSPDRESAEVKMSAVTSRFVYISRHRQDIIDGVKGGEVLSLVLDVQDAVDRPCKFPTYIITRYPVNVNPSLAKELMRLYTACCFLHNGKPINRLVISWNRPETSPALTPPSSLVNYAKCLMKSRGTSNAGVSVTSHDIVLSPKSVCIVLLSMTVGPAFIATLHHPQR